MTRLIDIETKNGILRVDLSDCWTRGGKPVWFRLRKIDHPHDPSIQAISFIFWFLSIKWGWITTTRGKP